MGSRYKTRTVSVVVLGALTLLSLTALSTALVMSDTGRVYTDETFDLYNTGIYPRLDLRELDVNPVYWRQRTLFLLALQKMQTNPNFLTDAYSYFQLAKVHGMPFGPYNNVVSDVWDPIQANLTQWWAGHCQHSNSILGPWHRLYVAAYERALRKAAIEVAQSFTYDKPQWAKAANELRLPRFDYADTRMPILGLPAIVLAVNAFVAHPVRRPPYLQRIRNPMHSYKFQANPADPSLCTIAGGCYGKSFMPDKRLTPFMPWATSNANRPMHSPAGSLTYRWPYTNPFTRSISSNSLLLDAMFRFMAIPLSLLQSVALTQSDYNCFWLGSGLFFGPQPTYSCPPTAVASINDVHGLVHGLVGGVSASGKLGGHMAPTETSGFDPMFWLLHSQLDYVWAMHQALYSSPSSWVQPGVDLFGTYYSKPQSTLDRTTPLPPWQKPGTTGFFNSDDTQDYTKFGYNYGPIEKARSMAAGGGWSLTDAMKQVYSAKYNTTSAFRGYQWLATWEFPLGQAAKVMPSTQFFAFASLRNNVSLPFLNGGIRLPPTLCGTGFNFNKMPADDSTKFSLNIIVTRCLQNAGLANIKPKEPGNPGAGPDHVPLAPERLILNVIGMNGRDFSSQIKVPPPKLTWLLDNGNGVEVGSA